MIKFHLQNYTSIQSLFVNKPYFAFSSGVDSVALAHWIKNRFKKSVTLAHFNHRIRPQNDHMEDAARIFAEDFGFDLVIDKREDHMETDFSEASLRNHRLNFYKKLDNNVLTAHHLDDAVESYLMNCFDGTPEYIPIKFKTVLINNVVLSPDVDGTKIPTGYSIFHPFLLSTKTDIENYAKEHDLMRYVVVDETNCKNECRRNMIRNEIIPKIGQEHIRTVVRNKFYHN
jgi:tRNA(Ile)-lysidine synthetase-like protein